MSQTERLLLVFFISGMIAMAVVDLIAYRLINYFEDKKAAKRAEADQK